MNRFQTSHRERLAVRIVSLNLMFAVFLATGCHKSENTAEVPSKEALLKQQISDTEHDPTMTPDAKARYIEFLKQKLGAPPAAAPTR